jgi:hypothetical protein
MRQSFNGLYARVQTVLEQEPTSGHWFVFTNKPRNRLKMRIPTPAGHHSDFCRTPFRFLSDRVPTGWRTVFGRHWNAVRQD